MRAVLALLLLLAQAAPSFDAASIRPVDEKALLTFRGTSSQNNRWTGTHVSAREIIEDAYESDGFDMPGRVIGGPDWLDTQHFDVAAGGP